MPKANKKGKITKKPQNEHLYVRYLTLLADQEDTYSTYWLASFYEKGSEFTKADPNLALSIYLRPCLAYVGSAWAKIGTLLQSDKIKKKDLPGALNCFARGMALYSLISTVRYADCYLYGLGVEPDPVLAFKIYSNVWSSAYPRFVSSQGSDMSVFPLLCARLGECYSRGLGVEASDWEAIRYYLLSALGYRLSDEYDLDLNDYDEVTPIISKDLQRLAAKKRLKSGSPVYDTDTFMASILDQDGAMPFFQPYNLHVNSYDEGFATLDFNIVSPGPQLVLDVLNLFCDFVPGNTHWVFEGVSVSSYQQDQEFTRVLWGDEDPFCSFLKENENGKESVLDFYVLPEENETEQETNKESKA